MAMRPCVKLLYCNNQSFRWKKCHNNAVLRNRYEKIFLLLLLRLTVLSEFLLLRKSDAAFIHVDADHCCLKRDCLIIIIVLVVVIRCYCLHIRTISSCCTSCWRCIIVTSSQTAGWIFTISFKYTTHHELSVHQPNNFSMYHICLLVLVGVRSATALLQHGTPFLSPSKTVHLCIVSSAT